MASIAAAEFRSRLREFSRSELAALIESLWEARGFEVERDADAVVAVHPETGKIEVFVPVPARRFDRWLPPREPRHPEATAVVLGGARPPTWARDDDLRVVDAGELRELLLYGVDGETRRTLLADVFEVDLTGDGFTTDGEGEPSRWSRLTALGPGRSAVVAVVGFLLVVGILVGTVAFGLGPLDGLADEPAAGSDGGPTTPAGVSTPTPAGASYPPGVSVHGVDDPDALAAAHVANLSDRSYTVVFEYREVGENHTGTIRETTEVLGDARYASHLDRAGTFETDPANVTDPAVISNVETFANGDVHYERIHTDDGVRYSRRPVYESQFPAHVSRPAGFVQRTLAAADTWLAGSFERNGVTFYRIRFEGDDRPAFEAGEGEAVIDEFGVVHLLRTQYRPAARPSVNVTVTLEYTDFRTTQITEPDWLSEFGNGTDSYADEMDSYADGTDSSDDGTDSSDDGADANAAGTTEYGHGRDQRGRSAATDESRPVIEARGERAANGYKDGELSPDHVRWADRRTGD